jgi:protein SCO1/2
VRVDSTWAENLRRIPDDSVAAHPAQRQIDVNLPEEKRVLTPGDTVPEVTLIDQDSTAVRLEDYRGKLLLLTFIYTSCPLPDYCPLMSQNFQVIHNELEPPVRRQVQLLSVSFDTRNDTPELLREYAARYTDSTEHWTFATGTPDEIGTLTSRLGVFYSYQDVEEIRHNLVTALVDRSGRIEEIWRGNDWQPEQVLTAIRDMTSEK